MTNGIDVSKYQQTVDYNAVKKAGKSFVIIRAGYGKEISQKDPYFEANYKAAKAAGLDVGAYWYSYAKTASEAIEEAKVCLQCIKGKQFEYPIYYDVEEFNVLSLGKEKVSEIIKAFCGYLEQQSYFVGLYMSRYYVMNNTTDEIQKSYALWIAEYNSECKYSGCGTVGMWQSCGQGSVSGVNGNVDLDTAYIDYPSIIKAAGLNGYVKSTTAGSTSTSGSTAKAATKDVSLTIDEKTYSGMLTEK